MLTLFKSLVLPRLEYGCQLWSPGLLKHCYALESVQRSFTKHIVDMKSLSYECRLEQLNLYSLQRRRDRYAAIYLWKIVENIVPNLSEPIKTHLSGRRGRMCDIKVVEPGHIGTLCHNSFRWRGSRIFNSLPSYIRNKSNCDIDTFKRELDCYLGTLIDNPCVPNMDNNLDSVLTKKKRWLPRDGLAN